MLGIEEELSRPLLKEQGMREHERATQVWAVLAMAASHRQILTYKIASRLVGVPAQGLAGLFGHIQSYCLQKGLPPLTSIAVNGTTGLPGTGFVAAADIPRSQADVFNYDWLKRGAPTAKELEAAYAETQHGRSR
jgi:hypothetical protein